MSEWSDIGVLLRKERETLGWSLEEVSHRTRIPVQTLRELEENDYSNFPSAAYSKSFLAQYSEHLDVDIADWLEHFESGNTFANLDTIGYLKGSTEILGDGIGSTAKKPLRRTSKMPAPPPPEPMTTKSAGLLQTLAVLTLTALFLGAGVYGFVNISDRIEQAAMYATDADAGSSPVLAPAPSVVPSRPAPPKRSRALNNPAPAVAEVVSEGSEDAAPPALIIDAPPPRAIIIEE